MADLKLGTTIGGSSVWHQGNFPLIPTGNTLTFNGFKVYTANDKPQATDNDFVSKESGGKYLSLVSFAAGVQIPSPYASDVNQNSNGLYYGSGDGATQTTCNLDIITWNGFGIKSSNGNVRTVWISARNGDINSAGNINANGQINSYTSAPVSASNLTRKDYVDNNIINVTTNVNTRVLRTGDTMTGLLTSTNFSSSNPATLAAHVTRLDQVIVKGTSIDFGTY